jgi:hypothetical protein
VIEQIHRRPHAYNLGRACFIDRTLPEEIAIQEFGEIRVDVAREAIIGKLRLQLKHALICSFRRVAWA